MACGSSTSSAPPPGNTARNRPPGFGGPAVEPEPPAAQPDIPTNAAAAVNPRKPRLVTAPPVEEPAADPSDSMRGSPFRPITCNAGAAHRNTKRKR
ncbi:hypothetical protein GCM10020366_14270 [Saccharopolyspora gregorii]|uniref:Uncharacterized protein n=1 Tax=Saccharopolyspora gregorii TaxID=33914 RepID=A0ABP6RN36_9PSEU